MLVNETNMGEALEAKNAFSVLSSTLSVKDICDFIYKCLVIYKDIYNEQLNIKETEQNQNLLDILDTESRNTSFHFRNEMPQLVDKGIEPKVDIGLLKITNYRRQLIFTIECKRLHCPPSQSKQYVVVKEKNTGGIERYKIESHGSFLPESAIVGYMEDSGFDFWFDKVNEWIENEATSDTTGFWNMNDKIKSTQIGMEISQYQSEHNRKTQPNIILYHFWVKMFS